MHTNIDHMNQTVYFMLHFILKVSNVWPFTEFNEKQKKIHNTKIHCIYVISPC